MTEQSNPILMIVIIVAVVIIVIAVAYFVYRYVRKSKDPAYADKLKRKADYKSTLAPAKAALKQAQKEYDGRLQVRQDAIKNAESDHQRDIKAQEKEIKSIEDQYSSSVDSFMGVRLYRDRAEYKGKLLRLTTTVHADVLTSQAYQAAQSAAQSVALADAQLDDINATAPVSTNQSGTGKGAQDTTALSKTTGSKSTAIEAKGQVSDTSAHLVIADSGTSNTRFDVALDSSQLDDARSFMTTFNCAAADSDNLRAQRSTQLDAAKAKLKDITDNTSAIDAAKQAYKEETKNRADLDAAQKAFDEAKYHATKIRDGLS